MEDVDKTAEDDEDFKDSDHKLLEKSSIPRPLSHAVSRPPSRPAPSARVRALGKEELGDVDRNSPDEEEDDDDEDEDDEDEEQGIQIEGARMHSTNPRIRRQQMNHPGTYSSLRDTNQREQLLRYRNAPVSKPSSISSESLSLSDGSLHDDDEPPFDMIQEERDLIYLELPYSHKRAYDPADFEHLPVSNEVKELFQFITRYTPQNIDLDTKLRPFIPEFIPAVGDIDAFIKVPRPDNVLDKLGLIALDEPCAKQSDPTVLDLQLRAISKETTVKSVAVKSLENADKRPKEIDAWISSISNLHRSKPPPTVHYSRNMPDIETLMQEWPPEFEDFLNQFGLPSAELDCSLDEYVELICGIMDIPVHRSKIQSLHVLFTLFLEFKNSQHFRSLAMNNELDNSMKKETSHSGSADQLVIRD